MARFEKEMAQKQVEERVRDLTKTEMEQKKMRFEWRKQLENGYEKDIEETKLRNQQE